MRTVFTCAYVQKRKRPVLCSFILYPYLYVFAPVTHVSSRVCDTYFVRKVLHRAVPTAIKMIYIYIYITDVLQSRTYFGNTTTTTTTTPLRSYWEKRRPCKSYHRTGVDVGHTHTRIHVGMGTWPGATSAVIAATQTVRGEGRRGSTCRSFIFSSAGHLKKHSQ